MRDYGGPKSLKGLFKILVGIFDSKQDNITGLKGQLVGFDNNGKPIAQEPPDTGVITFKGREGSVEPLPGDYTAQMVGADPVGSAEAVRVALNNHTSNKTNPHAVTCQQIGALPLTGGTLTGPLIIGRMKLSWNQSAQAIDIEVI